MRDKKHRFTVEESENFSLDSLRSKLNEMSDRGWYVIQVLPADSSDNGYRIIATRANLKGDK